MTPRELAWEFAAQKKRAEDLGDRLIVQAWQIERVRVISANNAHAKQPMPSLQDVLKKSRVERQTPVEMRKALQMLSKQYGGPLKAVIH